MKTKYISEINKTIAEACGWSGIIKLDYGYGGIEPEHEEAYMPIPIPDYYGSLGECAEMEQMFHVGESLDRYQMQLAGVVSGWKGSVRESVLKSVFATAPQRCEAFLKILGLWKEEWSK